jgi:hypothetical protein
LADGGKLEGIVDLPDKPWPAERLITLTMQSGKTLQYQRRDMLKFVDWSDRDDKIRMHHKEAHEIVAGAWLVIVGQSWGAIEMDKVEAVTGR